MKQLAGAAALLWPAAAAHLATMRPQLSWPRFLAGQCLIADVVGERPGRLPTTAPWYALDLAELPAFKRIDAPSWRRACAVVQTYNLLKKLEKYWCTGEDSNL